MTVLESQKGSASLHPAHSESVLQTGIGPLDSDHSPLTLSMEWWLPPIQCQQDPSLGCNKRRDFIQANTLQTGETQTLEETNSFLP